MMDRMPLKLMYITNDRHLARIAEKAGVDRIWVDLETRGKDERQKNRNTVKSNHNMTDVSSIREIVTKSTLMVRVNPLYSKSKSEIDEVISRGADLIMLPMLKSVEDAQRFIEYVNGRSKTMLLIETPEAVEDLDRICHVDGIDEIHIGLNDLHIAMQLKFMFELLANGTVERLMEITQKNGIPAGFGGIAKLDDGKIPARHIIAEHYRLGSSMAILSRSFYDNWLTDDYDEIESFFNFGISEIREYEKRLLKKNESFFENNYHTIKMEVDSVVAEITDGERKKCRDVYISDLSSSEKDYDRIEKISKELGNAFYILDTVRFKDNYYRLKRAFSDFYSNVNVAYSYKTNYTPRLIEIIDCNGAFSEIVSMMELDIALKCGVNPQKIIWNGPIKEKKDLEFFLLKGGIVNIDNYSELDNIVDIAQKNYNNNIRLGIRCNYDVGDGVKSRFGMDVYDPVFEEHINKIQKLHNATICALHVHFANRDPIYWEKRVEGIIEIYSYLEARYGIKAEIIDLGGGIFGGMPSNMESQVIGRHVEFRDYAAYTSALSEFFEKNSCKPLLIIEPGTALIADCMSFIAKVQSCKTIRGRNIANTYVSQKNINMQGVCPPVKVLSKKDKHVSSNMIDIAGYTCIENDYIYKGFTEEVSEGDFICVGNCGSYSNVMKPPFIFPNAPIIEIDGDTVHILKRQEFFEDIISTYRF